ncbi:MAG: HAD family phosphatase [Lachnospiraceae bacterium]
MKNFKYAIFDMDGTLLDSMQMWRNLGRDYLIAQGKQPFDNLEQVIQPMSMEESAEYFQEQYGIRGSVTEIIEGVNEMIESAYKKSVLLKKGVKEYLQALNQKGVQMCIATATSKHLALMALKRLDILKYFTEIIDCGDSGVGKHQPDIYHLAVKHLHGTIEETAVFEDAWYAMETAKQAGFYTVGVYDAWEKVDKERIVALCDDYVESFAVL